MTRLLLILMFAIAWPSTARAGGVVFESYRGARTAAHERALQSLLAELERGHELVARPGAVRALLGIAVAAPASADADRSDAIAAGYRAYLDGRYEQAIPLLAAAIADAHANPLRLVWSARTRGALLDALVALAVSYQRRAAGGDRARAIATMHELIRSYPERESLRADYGPEPDALYREALASLRAHGPGHLVIDTDDPAAQLYIDEREQAHGATLDAALLPGTYRVLVTGRAASNRRYDVTVSAGATTRLPLRADIGQAFLASERWVGFAGAREEVAVAYARALVQPLGRDTIVLVGERTWQGAPALEAAVYRASDGSLVSRHVAVLDAQVDRRIAALARAVQGRGANELLVADASERPAPTEPQRVDEDPDDEEEPEEQAPAQPVPTSPSPRILGAGGLGLVGVVGIVLAIHFAGEANHAAGELDALCAVRCTTAQAQPFVDANASARRNAIVSGVIGGAALVGGTALILYSRHRLTVTPRAGGAVVSYGRAF